MASKFSQLIKKSDPHLRNVGYNLVYGWQVFDRALMACLVFECGRQVYFVDGADASYALGMKN
ncbi:DUF3095 family protein [Microcoleus sp. F10-D1]|uniref:DUF3095 family protein n=1 Tax=unclassified Microcoleus TaxID=2642155 RepID=UPI002FD16714